MKCRDLARKRKRGCTLRLSSQRSYAETWAMGRSLIKGVSSEISSENPERKLARRAHEHVFGANGPRDGHCANNSINQHGCYRGCQQQVRRSDCAPNNTMGWRGAQMVANRLPKRLFMGQALGAEGDLQRRGTTLSKYGNLPRILGWWSAIETGREMMYERGIWPLQRKTEEHLEAKHAEGREAANPHQPGPSLHDLQQKKSQGCASFVTSALPGQLIGIRCPSKARGSRCASRDAH